MGFLFLFNSVKREKLLFSFFIESPSPLKGEVMLETAMIQR